MRIGVLGLAIVAGAPFLIGWATQDQGKKLPYADQLFAEAKEEHFLGDKSCLECHPDAAASFANSAHAPYMLQKGADLAHSGCEGCHGPGALHLDEGNPRVVAFGKLSPKDSSLACLRCHKETLTASHWNRTGHAKADLSCVSCHQIHPSGLPGQRSAPPAFAGSAATVGSPANVAKKPSDAMLKGDEAVMCGQCHRAQVAEFRKVSHHPVPEGRVLCSDCHSPHPSRNDRLRETPYKDSCVRCHAGFAGPFAFEHDPVAGFSGSGCVECHRPHGSQNPRLLKAFSRGLCAQCHTDKSGGHYPGRTCWQAGCHVAPHGSNTDPLLRSH